MEWEQIDSYHTRARVVGGWLVKAYEEVMHIRDGEIVGGWDFRVAMAFVPDPMYNWTIRKEDG